MNTQQSLYEQDFYAWAIDTVEKLKYRQFNDIDIDHLMEEVEGMSGRERQELRNRLAILLMHLLKWQYQPDMRSKSWEKTIKTQRIDISYLFDDSPSLKHYVDDLVVKAYRKAVVMASNETGLAESVFPKEQPYKLENILKDGYYPMD